MALTGLTKGTLSLQRLDSGLCQKCGCRDIPPGLHCLTTELLNMYVRKGPSIQRILTGIGLNCAGQVISGAVCGCLETHLREFAFAVIPLRVVKGGKLWDS